MKRKRKKNNKTMKKNTIKLLKIFNNIFFNRN